MLTPLQRPIPSEYADATLPPPPPQTPYNMADKQVTFQEQDIMVLARERILARDKGFLARDKGSGT